MFERNKHILKPHLLSFSLLALAFAAPLSAATSYFLGLPSFQRDYVLAGDPAAEARNGVEVSMAANISTTTSEAAFYRFAWELQQQSSGGAWSRVSLNDYADDVHKTTFTYLQLDTDPGTSDPNSELIAFTEQISPAQPLDPYTQYRVRGRLQTYSGGTWVDATPTVRESSDSKFYQFTNTTSGDDARNVIATLDTTALSNPFFLDGATDSAKRGFTVDVAATARRWDDFEASAITTFNTFRYEVILRESGTSTEIPLETSTFYQTQYLDTYNDSTSPASPSEQSFSKTLTIAPTAQLDPVNQHYEVEVTIKHVENPNTDFVQTGNTRSLLNQRLYAFNGQLHFGSTITQIEDFVRDPQPTTSLSGSYVSMTLNGVDGHLDGLPNYSYEAPSTVSLRLLSNGTAVVQSLGAAISVTPPNLPDIDSSANVRYARENMTLESGRLQSDLTVFMPQGMGYLPPGGNERTLAGSLAFSNQSLDSQLGPTASTLTYHPAAPVRVLEETKPTYVLADEIIWNRSLGEFDLSHSAKGAGYVRSKEAAYLAGAPVPTERRVKPDNTGYYAALAATTDQTSTIAADANGTAQLATGFQFGAAVFKTHFPLNATIQVSSGEINIDQDSVEGGYLDLGDAISLAYGQGCADDLCGVDRQGRFTVDPGALNFTADGGLIGEGPLLALAPEDLTLSWGYIDTLSSGNPAFAQSLGEFGSATFHMTGHFIRGQAGGFADFTDGGTGDTAARNGPAEALLAAVKGPSEGDSTVVARPGSPEDRNGQYYYAGINLETTGDGDVTGVATIAGQEGIAYSLRGCNKFYARPGGVTGTVEAVPGTFPTELTLNGYSFNFDYYGLGYLDSNTNAERSFTSGELTVPFPVDTTFEFDGLSFSCLGALDDARLPAEGLAKNFAYWNADIDISSLSFTSSASCNPGDPAFLTLGTTAYSTLIDQPLHGLVGVRPNGQLVTQDFSLSESLDPELASRFRLPNNLKLAGPEEEQYDLITISEAYLNNYELTSEQAPGDGRMNFAAKIDVPFFEDLAAHIRTTASRNTNPNATLDLMGGWTENSQTFFDTAFFDTVNRGFPSGVDEALYRNENGASGDPKPYLITARQNWLEVVNLEYPLDWSSSLRSFSAFEPAQDEEILIIEVDHQLEYLSAENAEISFGATYQGIPRINLSNFAFNKIDPTTGVRKAATDALSVGGVDALDRSTSSMDNLLQDKADALVDQFLQEKVDAIIEKLYTRLETASENTNPVNDWNSQVQDELETLFVDDNQPSEENLREALKNLGANTGQNPSTMIEKIDSSLEDLQLGLRMIHDSIYLIDGEVQLEAPADPDAVTLDGLLHVEDGEFQIAQALVVGLITGVSESLGSEVAGILEGGPSNPLGELETLINGQLDEIRPTLERVSATIERLDNRIGAFRDGIENGTKIVGAFQAILSNAGSQIDSDTAELKTTVNEMVLAEIPSRDRFDEITKSDLKQRIRDEIGDTLHEADFIKEFQQVLRQHLYDIDLEIDEAIDTAFAQINVAIRNLLGSYLADIDNSITGVLGDIDSVVGAGQFDGFAHINGDALRLLRIDAALQFKVPKDMEFNGYFQIKQLASDGSGSCSYSSTGTPAKEITLGTPGVPVEWLSPGMEIAVEGKVTYSDRPLGLGGSMEMVGGSFNFEAFEITDLGAAMSFGQTENYIAAKVGLVFQNYDVYGGVFFGQTCTIEPVKLVNEQAASVIGDPNPTFTGAYVYGEAHIPVSEALLGIPASCVFRIDAGVGLGAFYFLEGPTFGGQMLLAVSGEALCLVSINGEVSMVGAKVGNDLRYSGRGEIGGRVGACPLCVKFSKSLQLEYRNDRWKFEL